MRLQVLYVPGCPHAALLIDRIGQLLGDRIHVERHVVSNQHEAVALGMRGSPTLLIDGADPFVGGDRPPTLSCRLFRDESGLPTGAPTLAQLRQALAVAGAGGA